MVLLLLRYIYTHTYIEHLKELIHTQHQATLSNIGKISESLKFTEMLQKALGAGRTKPRCLAPRHPLKQC